MTVGKQKNGPQPDLSKSNPNYVGGPSISQKLVNCFGQSLQFPRNWSTEPSISQKLVNFFGAEPEKFHRNVNSILFEDPSIPPRKLGC